MAKPTKDQQARIGARTRRLGGNPKKRAPLTKREFERLIKRAAQPVRKAEDESDSEELHK